jgi:WD40 repeat protein
MSRRELEVLADLQRLARDWDDANRDDSYLLRGARLAQATELRRTRHDELDPVEVAYLTASQARATAELEHTRRTNRRLQRLVAGLAILLLAALGASGLALRLANTAQQQTLIARSRELAARAGGLLEVSPQGALLVALESYRTAPTNEAMAALTAGLRRPQHGIVKVTGQEHYVRTVAFSPNGATVASGGLDGMIRRWDADSGDPIGTPIEGPGHAVWEVAYSPNGRELAAATGDGTVRRYDAVRGDPIGDPLIASGQVVSEEPTYDPHPGRGDGIRTVAYSPTGETLVAGGADGTIWRWQISGVGSLGATLDGISAEILDVAYSPDGRTIAAATGDGSIRRWDASTGESLRAPLDSGSEAATAVTYSRDGTTLAAAGSDGVRLWDVASGSFSDLPLGFQPAGVNDLAFVSDGTILATTGGDDGSIQLWDVETSAPLGAPLHRGLLVAEDEPPSGPQMGPGAWAVAFSPDGRTLAGGYDDGIVLWNIAPRELLGGLLPTGDDEHPSLMTVSPDGATLALRDHNGELWLMDAETGHLRATSNRPGMAAPIYGDFGAVLTYSSDARTLATCSGAGLRLWDGRDGDHIGAITAREAHNETQTRSTRLLDALACPGADGTVRLWDVTDRLMLGPPLRDGVARDPDCSIFPDADMECSQLTRATLSPDATIVAAGSSDGNLTLWDTSSRELLSRRATGSDHEISVLEFSPDGTILASASLDDDAILLWSSATLEPSGILRTDDDARVSSVVFSQDGGTLAVGSDKGVQLWDVDSQTLLGTPTFDHDGTTQVIYSPDGTTIYSLNDEGVRLWAAPQTWVTEICQIVGRNLTLDEWTRLMGPEADYVRTCPMLPAGNQSPSHARAARYPDPLVTPRSGTD